MDKSMKKYKRTGKYNPEIDFAKGATLTAASYDKTQEIAVTARKVTVGGAPGGVRLSGIATGRHNASIDGTVGIWLSIFRYRRPDGSVDHVAGWNIMLPLAAGQTPETTATALVDHVNAGTRPYRAAATGSELKIVFTVK